MERYFQGGIVSRLAIQTLPLSQAVAAGQSLGNNQLLLCNEDAYSL